MSTTEQITPAQRDAIESIADQLARLAETVRSLIPERDPVEGKDYLAPMPQLEVELPPADDPRYYMWAQPRTSRGPFESGELSVHGTEQLP